MVDDWVTASLSDDNVAAELLLQLRRSHPHGSTMPRRLHHHRRTTAPPEPEQKAGGESGRASPSTPLSWSGGGSSPSRGAEGELIRPLEVEVEPPNSSKSRSQSQQVKSTTKRSRKKKTLGELHEEETSLLEEQKCLRHNLTKVLGKVEKQRVMNMTLKKRKMDLQEQPPSMEPQFDHVTTLDVRSCPPPIDHCFVLPDLNMPAEEG